MTETDPRTGPLCHPPSHRAAISFQQMGDNHSPMCDRLVPGIRGEEWGATGPHCHRDLAALQVGTHAGQWTELALEVAMSSIKL